MANTIRDHLGFKGALVSAKQYEALYKQSIAEPEKFWAEQAEHYLHWDKKWKKVLSGDLTHHNVRWFEGAELNACYNCLDRHLPERAKQTAIIWEGDSPDESSKLTFAELHEQVCRFANGLKSLGVKKGDRVCIYLPMIPEAAIAMLACARIGAVHSVVFGGFSAHALQSRIVDAECSVLITADAGVRGGKTVTLKSSADKILGDCPSIKHCVVVQHANEQVDWHKRDVWFHELVKAADSKCPCEVMRANDPLFILYTSGSTGKPKGILHSTAGYLLYATMTFKLVFNYQDGDTYWCTADVGWITGHSYLVYGPLANGATTLMFAGVPTYPSPARFWQVVDKHQVNIFYTAPTAIRALMRQGDAHVKQSSRRSLKLLATVGEPINPDVWLWYYNVVGDKRCPVVDTWWQTETGGIMITPLPGATPLKPGSVTKPFFGVEVAVLDDKHKALSGEAKGELFITKPWPGQLLTIYGDQKRFIKTYFSQSPGNYCAGDDVRRDTDGYYWISGRSDDVLNVSGHRLETAEIESAIVAHQDVAEAAVVGCPHEIKGQGICAFVTPKAGVKTDDGLVKAVRDKVNEEIGPIAKPDQIYWVEDLPKTRSGKIMRRILRKIVNHEEKDLGDISTLANPDVVEQLIRDWQRNKKKT